MKKIAFLAIALSFSAAHSMSQEFYLSLGLGYAFPQASQTLDGTGTPYNGSINSTTYTNQYSLKKASFSSGSNAAVGFGCLFNDHVGVQMDAAFNLAATSYTYSSPNVSYGGYSANESVIQQAKTNFMLMPSLVLQTGGDNKWNLYARLGLALPLSTTITEDEVFYIPQLPENDDYTIKIKNSFSLGFTGAIGAKYRLNEKVSVWGEASFLSLSQYIKEADLSKVSANGYSVPLDSVSGPHTIKYSKNVSVDTNQASQPTYSQPFSNIGFKVGVTFTLSKHEKARKNDDDYIDKSKPFRRNH